MTVDQAGTEANPVFAQTPAPLMDSMEALTRSMAGIARSRFFDDLKHRSVEDWVAQFADTLNAPIGEVRADPWRFIRDAPQFWKKDYHDAPKMAAARDARRNILALMNEDTVDMTIAKWAHHKVIDSLFQARGIQGMKILHPTLWDSRTDPVTIARSAVFHMKLGLLNVLQFPLQGMAVITAAAMDGSPLRAAQANFAYWGMRMRGLAEANPKAQGLITRKISEALGVDRKTLDEMFQVWRDSGMHRIEGEYAKRDDVFNPRMFLDRNTATRGLDAGTFFFKEGNNWHRGVSFATAFLRWRKDNPTKAITNEDMMRIVGRADDMYLNMSKASNNPNIQRGLMSVPTQFFAYHLRVMELMTGHRLTPMEKARMMGVYSLIWGLPVGVGGTMVGAVWPAHDAIRQYALEHGMDVDANPIIQFMMDGTVSMMTSYFTEMDFDVGNRFGPGGMTWLRDLIDGNLLDALGAAPNMINTVLETASPFARMFGAAFSEDGFEVTTDDIISAFREISTVNNVYRAYWMYNAGEWRTRQEAAVHNVPGAEGNLPAAIAVALGLTPKDVADHYILMRSNKQFDDAKRAAEQEALIHLRRSVRAAQDGEFERSEQALKNFYIILNSAGFTPMERAAVARRFYRDHSDQVDEAERQFMRRDPARRQELILRRQQERMERRLD